MDRRSARARSCSPATRQRAALRPRSRLGMLPTLILLALAFPAGFRKEMNATVHAASRRQPPGQRVPRSKSAAGTARAKADRMGNHYLLLVNSAVAAQMDAQKMTQFARSPYDGLAVSFVDAYDTAPVPSAAAMEAQIANWNKVTAKDIWPWVYLNRMIGANAAEGNEYSQAPYFLRFQGADLDDKAGAQKDFLESWRNALRTARDTGVPGIVCDLEFYNNYRASDPGELARMTGKPLQDAVKLLKQLGARMADIADDEYPGATLWFFFTGFTRPRYRVFDGRPFYLAATYIVEGLLDEIQQHPRPPRVLSGGEVGLGYCHNSVEDLHQAIDKRASIFSSILRKYAGILELAGTMTLWSDRAAKRSWVAQGNCATSSAATVEDLEPYLELLLRTYRYNWVYGSVNGGYYAFEPKIAPRFDLAVSQAKASALRNP